MTSPKDVKDLLIDYVSFRRSPSIFTQLNLSDPAKSIKLRVPEICIYLSLYEGLVINPFTAN